VPERSSDGPRGLPETDISQALARLDALTRRLRRECPWDREQDERSIVPHTLEEAYELADAAQARDDAKLVDELGDVLFQVHFLALLLEERGVSDLGQVAEHATQKLIRRHPHVFGEQTAETAGDVRRIWGEVKAEEKKQKGANHTGLLDSVPRALPALVEAQQLTTRAAHVGFDWDHAGQVLEKLHEELAEFDAARRASSQEDLEGELGDMLFVLVNLARFVKVDPEQALRKTNAKFRHRFGYIERKLGEQGRSPEDATLAEMDALWEESKR
jgi:MazG family protein